MENGIFKDKLENRYILELFSDMSSDFNLNKPQENPF